MVAHILAAKVWGREKSTSALEYFLSLLQNSYHYITLAKFLEKLIRKIWYANKFKYYKITKNKTVK